ARRRPGSCQGRLRQEDRPASWRTHDRRGGNRTDPGLCGSDESRDDGRRADAHRLPASDPVGDDEGSRARRLWARVEYMMLTLLRAPSRNVSAETVWIASSLTLLAMTGNYSLVKERRKSCAITTI